MDTITIQPVVYGTDLYDKAIELRYDVLRKPLNMQYTPQQLLEEKEETHIVALLQDTVIGVLLLKKINDNTIKMRQVAIASTYQRAGIGTQLVKFAEQYAIQHNFSIIELHARDTAVNFYLKNKYEIVGDVFFEVSIPHYKMIKQLN